MKSKIVVLVLALLTGISIGYAYIQRKEAAFQREQYMEMHREIVRLRQESEAARVEAAKLRSMIELERKRAEEALAEVQSKSKRK